MKRFMVVFVVDGSQEAVFFDSYSEASRARMDIECGLGGYAELYERVEVEGSMEYVFLEA